MCQKKNKSAYILKTPRTNSSTASPHGTTSAAPDSCATGNTKVHPRVAGMKNSDGTTEQLLSGQWQDMPARYG